MSDQEKSVMLARAMGWHQDIDGGWAWTIQPNTLYLGSYSAVNFKPPPDLYDPANMALAWRVLQWHWESDKHDFHADFDDWWHGQSEPMYAKADAQRAWLDKCLSLAVEAGLVEVEAETHL
jgi:hypothetical protein